MYGQRGRSYCEEKMEDVIYTAAIYKDNWQPSTPWRAKIFKNGVQVADTGPYRTMKNIVADLEGRGHITIKWYRDKTRDC